MLRKIFTQLLFIFLLLSIGGCTSSLKEKGNPPNILFISIDDLNDWTGIQQGHPQANTPNLDRLAARGVFFNKAYTAAPACNPSRVAILTGISPTNSGIYYNEQSLRLNFPDIVTMPHFFRQNGYVALGSGKIFHRLFPDSASWDEFVPSPTSQRFPFPEVNGNKNGLSMNHFDWGSIPVSHDEMPDTRTVRWVSEQLQQDFEQPFFLACGIYRPHLPWYVPADHFEKYPLDSIRLPETIPTDLEDVPSGGQELIRFNDHHQVTQGDQWKAAVQGYLASIDYTDKLLGELMEALDKSPHKENTIIVLWSDHGWNLGEKEHWRKFALWERTTHVPLLFIVPKESGVLAEGTPSGEICERPVNLLDVFPTLVELAGLQTSLGLDGRSLVPLLKTPDTQWNYPSVTSYGRNNHAVRSERYRYIQYADQSEELYDLLEDRREFNNLAKDEAFGMIISDLKKWIPNDPVAEASFGEFTEARAAKPGRKQ